MSSSTTESDLDEHSQLILKVRALMRKREEARDTKNFLLSDTLRKELITLGVDVKDQKNGPSGWKFVDGRSRKLPSGVILTKETISEVTDSISNKKRLREESAATTGQQAGKKQVLSQLTKDTDVAALITKNEKEPISIKKTVIGKDKDRAKSILNKLLGEKKTIEGVLIEDISDGTTGGRKSKNGDKIKMHYVGKLKSNNKVFDSSGNRPFSFKLGRGEVIRGWDVGCCGMSVGQSRRLTIPPEKGYGRAGAPPTIPGNATLIFDIKLVEIL